MTSCFEKKKTLLLKIREYNSVSVRCTLAGIHLTYKWERTIINILPDKLEYSISLFSSRCSYLGYTPHAGTNKSGMYVWNSEQTYMYVRTCNNSTELDIVSTIQLVGRFRMWWGTECSMIPDMHNIIYYWYSCTVIMCTWIPLVLHIPLFTTMFYKTERNISFTHNDLQKIKYNACHVNLLIKFNRF